MRKGWLLAAALLAGCGGEDDEGSNNGSNHVPSAATGAMIYAANCSGCHGAEGAGSPAFPSAPRLDTADVAGESDAELVAKIRDGDGAMPAFGGSLTAEQIQDVVAYLRTLGM